MLSKNFNFELVSLELLNSVVIISIYGPMANFR